MKLYFSVERTSEPGSAEPWQVPGKQDRKADRVDVPSSPLELAAWLNARRVGREPALELEEAAFQRSIDTAAEQRTHDDPLGLELEARSSGPRVPGHCDACGRSGAGALKLQQGNELEAIGYWMETAELWAIEQLVERARGVVRERGQVLEGRESVQ
jgi:hypothetical protein